MRRPAAAARFDRATASRSSRGANPRRRSAMPFVSRRVMAPWASLAFTRAGCAPRKPRLAVIAASGFFRSCTSSAASDSFIRSIDRRSEMSSTMSKPTGSPSASNERIVTSTSRGSARMGEGKAELQLTLERTVANALEELAGELLHVHARRHVDEEPSPQHLALLPLREVLFGTVVDYHLTTAIKGNQADGERVEELGKDRNRHAGHGTSLGAPHPRRYLDRTVLRATRRWPHEAESPCSILGTRTRLGDCVRAATRPRRAASAAPGCGRPCALARR